MKRRLSVRGWILCVLLGLIGLLPNTTSASAAVEEKYDTLQIGSQTYRNVTVTTKNAKYVFILHSTGMANLKTSELPVEVLVKLGYPDPTAPKTNAAAAWAKQTVARLETPEVQKFQKEVLTRVQGKMSDREFVTALLNPKLLIGIGAAFLFLYLFSGYCCMLICQKAGSQPGGLVWFPVLQLLPLLRAARISRWWFLGFLVPVLNTGVFLYWCLKIAHARGKSVWAGIFLFLPVTGLFAFLYLAFSDGAPSKKKEDKPRITVMTLETA